MQQKPLQASEIADRVHDVLARAQAEAAAIRVRAEEEARGFEPEARDAGDRLVRQRIDRLREARDAIRERSSQVETRLRRFADRLSAGTDHVVWATAAVDRTDRTTAAVDSGRELSGASQASADEGAV